MVPQEEKLRGALWGAIAGDALATPLGGMSRGHIHSAFREIRGYTDPGPALKGKESSWKKPGLYTASSQLALLLAFTEGQSTRGSYDPAPHVAAAALHGGGPCGIFRHPDALLLDTIQHCQARIEGRDQSRDPRIDLLPPLHLFLPLLALRSRRGPSLLLDSLRLARFITPDILSMAASAILVSILDELLNSSDRRVPVDLVIDAAQRTLREIRENPAPIFDLKLNPETLAVKAALVVSVVELLKRGVTPAAAEAPICAHAMGFLKHNITRATVNHPLTLAPYILSFFISHSQDPGPGFFAAAAEGGAAGTLSASAGTLWGALHGAEAVPPELRDGLVNKSRIAKYIDAIARGRTRDVTVKDFLDSEASLTQKEREELQARLRHVKVKEKKQKTKNDRERELNRHVVESWTKLDKAKWKKREKDPYSE
jgi:hypothetical protein